MKIFLAGHKGLVGSAILRKLKKKNWVLQKPLKSYININFFLLLQDSQKVIVF